MYFKKRYILALIVLLALLGIGGFKWYEINNTIDQLAYEEMNSSPWRTSSLVVDGQTVCKKGPDLKLLAFSGGNLLHTYYNGEWVPMAWDGYHFGIPYGKNCWKVSEQFIDEHLYWDSVDADWELHYKLPVGFYYPEDN